MATFDSTHEEWVGEIKIRLSGEDRVFMEWFETEAMARAFERLSEPQRYLWAQTRRFEQEQANRGQDHTHGTLVSGHVYRTAIALENKGLGRVRYQGPSLGWFTTAGPTTEIQKQGA